MPVRETLRAQPTSLSEIFSNGRRYVVPRFQRDYAWNTSEWEELWADLSAVADDPGDARHYLGALVLQEVEGTSALRIIDGQQRLVTLSILALAIIRRIEGLAEAGVESEGNRERVRLLREKFVSTRSAASLEEHARLTLNDANDGFYRNYLVQPVRPRVKGLTPSERRLWQALTFFDKRLGERWPEAVGGSELASFLDRVVGERLRFIEIRVTEDETAYTVFETLNARGVALSTADLIKNYLFACASRGGESDLRNAQQLWDRVVGRVPLDRLSTMMFHRMAAWIPNLTEKRVFTHVKRRVPGHQSVFDFLREMDETSVLYTALDDPEHDYWADVPEARPHIRTLEILRVEQCRPLLLAAIPALETRPLRVVRLLDAITRLSVRTVVARLNTGDIKRAYQAAARAVEAGTVKRPPAIMGLLRAIRVEDDRFRESFATLSMDPKGRRKRMLRYLLSELERDLTGHPLDFGHSDATIEHILPQNAGEAYATTFRDVDVERYQSRLGNLTPLEAGLNRALGAAPFDEKREVYARSRFHLTREIEAHEWSPDAIRARQRRMADAAVRIWSDYEAEMA